MSAGLGRRQGRERGQSDAQADALAYDEDGARPPLSLDVALPVRLPLRRAATATMPHSRPNGSCQLREPAGRRSSRCIRCASLIGAIAPAPLQEWATFYDIRRYGGLQIFLRALAGQGSLRLSGADEPIDEFLDRLGDVRRSRIFRVRPRIGGRRS